MSKPIATSITAATLLGYAFLQAQQVPVFKLLYSVPNSSPIGEPTAILEVTPGLFYGLSIYSNGTYGGTIYSITSAGNLKLIYGLPPVATAYTLVQSPDGLLWGDYGTGQNQGVYFSMMPNATNVRTYSTGSFGAPGNVTQPAPLDMLYDIERPIVGQTYVFSKISPSGQITALHEFSGTDGFPQYFSPTVRGVDGDFYGIATQTLSSTPAWIYKITPEGQYSKLVQFPQYPLGSLPGLPLTGTLDGNLYGAFGAGGVNHTGVIYKATPAGVLSMVASFPAKGMSGPQFLMEASDGNLYGSTTSAPSYIFRLVRSTNKLEQVYSMNGSQGQCLCILTEGMDGTFYGTAARGGQVGIGTIFSLDIGLPPPPPVITQVSAPVTSPGTNVLIWGRWLLGATSITFNGVPAATLKTTSVQTVWATVPQGATTGPITITTANGSYTTPENFVVQ